MSSGSTCSMGDAHALKDSAWLQLRNTHLHALPEEAARTTATIPLATPPRRTTAPGPGLSDHEAELAMRAQHLEES
eukprot:1640859-Alexandrium_andersonii.AAC.1